MCGWYGLTLPLGPKLHIPYMVMSGLTLLCETVQEAEQGQQVSQRRQVVSLRNHFHLPSYTVRL